MKRLLKVSRGETLRISFAQKSQLAQLSIQKLIRGFLPQV